jgi:hypothetical protein
MLRRYHALVSVALLGCVLPGCSASPPAARPPERLPPSLAKLERLAHGDRIALEDAELFVPRGHVVPADGQVPLSIHFQGGVTIAEENFARMQRRGVLIASKLKGLSSAFAKPFADPQRFRSLLASGESELARLSGRDVRFAPITITFFSAGYGAVRELLKEPEFFDRITALVSADSIYASVVAAGVRAPHAEQMVDFMRFAQRAARGEKTFVLVHGMYQTPYASTAECADLILASVNARRQPADRYTERGIKISAEAHVGSFHAYTVDESGPGIHMDCLYMIPELVRWHVGVGR